MDRPRPGWYGKRSADQYLRRGKARHPAEQDRLTGRLRGYYSRFGCIWATAALTRIAALFLGFALAGGSVLQAIVARQPSHQGAARPIGKHPADSVARDSSHCGRGAPGALLRKAERPMGDV